MIVSFILYFVGIVLAFFTGILQIITIAVPAEFITAPRYFLLNILYLEGYLNTDALLSVAGWILVVLYYALLFKGFRFLWAHMPWIGTSNHVKTFEEYEKRDPSYQKELARGRLRKAIIRHRKSHG